MIAVPPTGKVASALWGVALISVGVKITGSHKPLIELITNKPKLSKSPTVQIVFDVEPFRQG